MPQPELVLNATLCCVASGLSILALCVSVPALKCKSGNDVHISQGPFVWSSLILFVRLDLTAPG